MKSAQTSRTYEEPKHLTPLHLLQVKQNASQAGFHGSEVNLESKRSPVSLQVINTPLIAFVL